MAKTLIATNTLTVINQVAYANHIQFYAKLGRRNPDDVFALFTPVRMTIDRCRNEAARFALENEFDYLMFIDDDVLIPYDCYENLKAVDKDVVAAWTVIRGYPFNNMFFRFNEKGSLDHYNDVDPMSNEPFRVDAIGCSCVLIKVDVFKKIPPPFFVTGTHHTEDIYFCMKLRDYQPEATIFVDPRIHTSHILASEAVTPLNRLNYKKFVEETEPEVLEKKEETKGDHDSSYFESVMDLFRETPLDTV